MKQPQLPYVLAAAVLISSCQLHGQIANFDMSGLSGIATSVSVTSKDANISTASDITRGAGLTAQSGSGVYSSSSWSFSSTSITAISNTDYITLSLAAAGGYEMSITSFSLKVSGSSTAPNTISAYSSNDSFTSNALQIGSNQTYTSTNTASPNTLTFTPATSIVGTALQIRVFGFGTTGPGGGAAANSGSIRFDDVTVNGSVSAVPEPSTYTTLVGCVALIGAIWRHQRKKRAA